MEFLHSGWTDAPLAGLLAGNTTCFGLDSAEIAVGCDVQPTAGAKAAVARSLTGYDPPQ